MSEKLKDEILTQQSAQEKPQNETVISEVIAVAQNSAGEKPQNEVVNPNADVKPQNEVVNPNAKEKPLNGAVFEEPQDEDSAELFISRPTVVYKLSDFEGPLDLLLTLIREAKISIDDIFVSDVTRQYIDIIKNTPKEEFDFEYAGEFITMAAELIYIKSLRTLPIEEIFEEEEDPEAIKRAFIQKAKEYALMKEQAEKLKSRETINRFYREPKYTEKDCRVAITNFSLPKLIEAFAQVLIMADKMKKDEIPKTVMKEKFSVYDQMNSIRQLLLDGAEISFFSLFDKDFDKSDIVTTFLAILELMKYQKIKAEQDEDTQDIKIYAVIDGDETPIIFEEDDDGEY
ncbi:MAG TPA: segregation/condensation protein A [Clostridia bacterium]|nr:segregation/condensation protein A [Clostridia bacterium]